MKMTKEHYKFIKDQFSVISYDDCSKYYNYLKTDKRVKDIEVRFAWDMFAARKLTSFACSHLYQYLNDEHITTALKRIVKELFPNGL